MPKLFQRPKNRHERSCHIISRLLIEYRIDVSRLSKAKRPTPYSIVASKPKGEWDNDAEICDFLTDLLHYCHHTNINLENLLITSKLHFKEELKESFPETKQEEMFDDELVDLALNSREKFERGIYDDNVRAWLDNALSSWLSTWDDLPDDEYPTFLSDIIKSLRNNNSPKFTREAYEEILFHLWQIYGQDDD